MALRVIDEIIRLGAEIRRACEQIAQHDLYTLAHGRAGSLRAV